MGDWFYIKEETIHDFNLLIGLLWTKPAKHRNLFSRQLDDGERQVHASWLDEHQKDQDRLQVIARSV